MHRRDFLNLVKVLPFLGLVKYAPSNSVAYGSWEFDGMNDHINIYDGIVVRSTVWNTVLTEEQIAKLSDI